MAVETTRSRLIVPPLATATAGAAAVGVTVLLGQAGISLVPACPLHAVTGLWCPLCGGTRAVQALASGDVVAAAGMNALVVVGIPLLLVAWLRWVGRRWRGQPADLVTLSSRGMAVVAVLLVAFMVVRNLPGMEALTP
jgi:hypothetical protein